MPERAFLFLSFFVGSLLFAPLAPLFKLDFALYFFLIFGAPVVCTLTNAAGQFYESIL
jgi:hypothetical protein